MDINIPEISELLASIHDIKALSKAIMFMATGLILASVSSAIVGKMMAKYSSAHYTMLIKRLFYYSFLFLFTIYALDALHFDITTLLGAAGILTVALSFASRTPISNIISGFFLVFEKPFVVGDLLELNGIQGEVLTIDLLSVKMRTLSNTMLRIPNEQLIKDPFLNLSRFPIRRLDILIDIPIHEDMEKVKTILFDIAKAHPLALENPAPSLFFDSFQDACVRVLFAIWASQVSFIDLKKTLPFEIQQAIAQHNIQVSMHHQVLHISETPSRNTVKDILSSVPKKTETTISSET